MSMTNTVEVTLSLPQDLHEHVQRVARATGQSLPDLLLKILRDGAPPDWTRAPAELQDELAALHSLDDEELAQIARFKARHMTRDSVILQGRARFGCSGAAPRIRQRCTKALQTRIAGEPTCYSRLHC